jgi:tetratricopeptide (TPR) repeat protein
MHSNYLLRRVHAGFICCAGIGLPVSAAAAQAGHIQTAAPDLAPAWGAGPDELALWNDPGFRKRFVESYLAESEVEPRVTASERDQVQKVLDLIAADKMDEAAALLGKHRTPAGSAVLDFTLANIEFQQERLAQAAANYEAAVKKYPKFRRAWRNLGVIHVRQGDFAPAVTALTRTIALGGHDADTYGLLGYGYANLEDHIAAESAYRMAALLDPSSLDWKLGLARSFFKQTRYADAAALCATLLRDHKDRADLWLLQANAYLGLEKPLAAAENFELVDRLGQSTAESLYTLGDIYVHQEAYDLAVDTYLRALAKSSKGKVERVLRAAKVLAVRAAPSDTRRLLERTEALHGAELPDAARKDVLKLRARLAVAEGASDEEARVLQQIVDLDPLDGEALILLGQHSGRAGDAEKAVFYYERAASITATEADAKVRHAQLLVGQGKYAEALPLLRRAQVLKPRDNIDDYLKQVERVAQGR